MKKKLSLLAIFTIAVAFLLVVGVVLLIAFSTTEIVNTSQYRIIRKFDQCYLIFHNQEYYKYNSTSGNHSLSSSQREYALRFSSLEEIYKDFMTCNFTDEEIANLKQMKHDSDGKIPISDIEHLYEPLFPTDFKPYKVIGFKDNFYSFSLGSSRREYYCNFLITSRDAYLTRKDMMTNLEDYTDITLNRVKWKEWTLDRNATIYYTNTSKIIVYSITTGNTTLHIEEHYSSQKDSIPSFVHLVGKSGNAYFTIYAQGFEERPSVKWYSQFSIRKHHSQ